MAVLLSRSVGIRRLAEADDTACRRRGCRGNLPEHVFLDIQRFGNPFQCQLLWT
jgi:hypothetical protein